MSFYTYFLINSADVDMQGARAGGAVRTTDWFDEFDHPTWSKQHFTLDSNL